MPVILELDGLHKRFGKTVAAAGLSLQVFRGEFFTLLGPSGSGKSTLLRMIAGLERPDAGRILIDGQDMDGVPPWKRNVGMVFQQYALFPHMTVAQNVKYGLQNRGKTKAEMDARVAEMLALVGLEGMEHKSVTVLSGGEQQRVALARALAPLPSVLLLDEPLGALDEKIRREMQVELRHIQRQTGTTFIYVTHDQGEALTMSDRVAVLSSGVCVQCDEPERLFRRPRTRFLARFFAGCNILEADVVSSGPRGVLRIAGEPVSLPEPLPPGATGRMAVVVRSENLVLGEDARTCPVQLRANVLGVSYRGVTVEYTLCLADGQRLVAVSTRPEIPETAAETVVGLFPESIVVLEDEAASNAIAAGGATA